MKVGKFEARKALKWKEGIVKWSAVYLSRDVLWRGEMWSTVYKYKDEWNGLKYKLEEYDLVLAEIYSRYSSNIKISIENEVLKERGVVRITEECKENQEIGIRTL